MRRLIIGLLAFGALSAPASASTWDYGVVVEGEVSYNRADVYEEGTAGQHDHAFAYRTTIPRARFADGVLTAPAGGSGSATIIRSHFGLTGPEGEYFECTGGSVEGVSGGGLAPSGGAIVVRPVGAAAVRVSTCTPPMAPGALRLLAGTEAFGSGPIDGRMTVPAEQIGTERVIVRTLSGDVRDARCPLQVAETELCSLSWTATVTLTRDESDLVVPISPDDDLFVPLVAKAKLTPAAAVLPVTCSAVCKGSVVARAGGLLGRARFSADAGRTARVRVPLRRAAERVRLVVVAGGERKAVTLRR